MAPSKIPPTSEDLSEDDTGHVEAIEVTYDPAKVHYQKLLDVFWENVDPLDEYGQFCDKGSQYRAGIFYHDEEQKKLAEASKKKVQATFNEPVATIISPASTFYPAEDYHQDYYIKNKTRVINFTARDAGGMRGSRNYGRNNPPSGMQRVFSLALAVYLVFYTFEGLIRYGFHLIGNDNLIFVRDALIIVPLLCIFIQQLFRKEVHPAFIIFAGVVVLHGIVMILNIGSVIAVVYSAKVMVTLLAGAIGWATLLKPGKAMLALMMILWLVSWGAVFADKYYMDMPWTGLQATIGEVNVDISRDWQMSGADKRAGGLMRSSINVACIVPLLAVILIFNLKNLPLRVGIALGTLPVLYWTTQKGAIIAYLLLLGLMALHPRHPLGVLRAGVFLTIALAVLLPLTLPGYTMPSTQGVFSFSTLYLRIEEMWPHAWAWIHAHDAFPFGVGLGGIGGAQRLYDPNNWIATDNIFIFMYGNFGMMTAVYLGAVLVMVARVKSDAPGTAAEAMAILVFLFGYGCVLTQIEDQASSLFMGAAIAYLCQEARHNQKSIAPLRIYERS